MAKKLKIGIVLDTSLDPNDGVQQYVLAIGGWLTKQGHEVHYLVGQTEQRQLPNLHSLAKNIKVQFNGNRTTIPLPTSRKKLRTFLQQHNFDILHVQVPHSPFMAQRLIVAAGNNTAVIGTFHILPYGKIPRLANHALGIWLKPSLNRFDKMLAVSPAAAKFAKQSFKIDSEVLPNVFDYDRYHMAKPFPQYDDEKLNILFLGRLVKRKGCLLLLQAIAKLINEGSNVPEFRVIICGSGHLKTGLQSFADKHGFSDKVEFVGFVNEEDKPKYYASADLAVFPSSGGESFGIVLLEAMASRRGAVLAGDNPGYRSVMEPQPELLFNPHNVSELADKLEHFLNDSQIRNEMAEWGANYSKDFDTEMVGHKLLKIYDQALLKRRTL
jgi:phosphatidyl-myo-inositol alpha-mannosyltransferase